MHINPDPRPVVVAVDASDSASDAAAWGAELAAADTAPLLLVHVVAGDPQDPPRERPRWLVELVGSAERAGARRVRAEVVVGSVVDVVSARAVGARMVVLGSYGAGTAIGPVGLGVLRRAACPVALVRGAAPRVPAPRGGPVVVAVDGSAADSGVVAAGAALASSLRAELVVAHVWNDGGPSAHHRSEPADVLLDESRGIVAQAAEPLLRTHPAVAVREFSGEGLPVNVLFEQARTARALVVGTRGATTPAGFLAGSVSTALAAVAPCPVVVVHARGTAPTVAPVHTAAGPAR